MRSLIIIEVEHEDTTDDVEAFLSYMTDRLFEWNLTWKDDAVRVDLPECFVLESEQRCSHCATALVNEDCPSYGNGEFHA